MTVDTCNAIFRFEPSGAFKGSRGSGLGLSGSEVKGLSGSMAHRCWTGDPSTVHIQATELEDGVIPSMETGGFQAQQGTV